MIGQISPQSPSQCPRARVRNSRDPIQSTVFAAALGVSRDKPVAVTRSVSLTSLIDSTVAFLTAFGLEALLYSSELWARLPVGVVLTMIVLLISWCVWTTLEAKGDFSLLERVHVLKDGLVGFTGRLRGKTSESRSDTGVAGDEGGQGKIERLSQSETLKETLNRFRRPRRPRRRTSATLVDLPPGATVVEMNKIKNDESGSAV